GNSFVLVWLGFVWSGFVWLRLVAGRNGTGPSQCRLRARTHSGRGGGGPRTGSGCQRAGGPGSGRLAAHDVDLVVDGAVGALGLEADLPVGGRDQGSGQEVQGIADGLAEEVGRCRGPGRGVAVRPRRTGAFAAEHAHLGGDRRRQGASGPV